MAVLTTPLWPQGLGDCRFDHGRFVLRGRGVGRFDHGRFYHTHSRQWHSYKKMVGMAALLSTRFDAFIVLWVAGINIYRLSMYTIYWEVFGHTASRMMFNNLGPAFVATFYIFMCPWIQSCHLMIYCFTITIKLIRYPYIKRIICDNHLLCCLTECVDQ